MRNHTASALTRSFLSACGVLALGATAPSPAHSGDLAAFLDRSERMTTVGQKTEAAVTITDADGTTRKAHLVLDPAEGGIALLEDAGTGWKSKTPLAWKDGVATPKSGAASAPLGVDAPLDGSDLRGIDFFPFWKTDYARAFVSDENTSEQTVSLFAEKGRPYSLYVITFDKAKLVPRMVKFYKDTFNNLVRIRTTENWVMVGNRPQPTQISVRDFTSNTERTYTFDWKTAPTE